MQATKPAVTDKSHLPAGHPPDEWGKIGVLLVNLGTPDATDYWSMRRYLKEFLSDRRVIEVNRVVWWFVLNFLASPKSARLCSTARMFHTATRASAPVPASCEPSGENTSDSI
jgi:hypothetical protein